MAFLPTNYQEMVQAGFNEADFIFISGDAYIDHPSFGVSIISRVLENFGYKVAIISQPQKNSDYLACKSPRLAFLVSSGNIDSMVNHYTVAKKRRSKDYYSPGGLMGLRPDRATTVYSKKLKALFPEKPVILGGIEASLRRLAHYDYWADEVMPSILVAANADLLVYGMGEKTIIEIADALNSGLKINEIIHIRNTLFKADNLDMLAYPQINLPSFEDVKNDKNAYLESFRIQYKNTDAFRAKALVEAYRDYYIVQNPPEFPLSRVELDSVYELPFMRLVHPTIEKQGHVPALDEVEFSLIINRGCYGACSFCALTMHQGRIIQSRSRESIIKEAKLITNLPNFKGYIHDVGGPTANFYSPSCQKQLVRGVCANKECIGFSPCRDLEVSHQDYLEILRELRSLAKVKKVFIRSGLRYDYILYDKDPTFLRELITHHISGQLKVAPEHISDEVLVKMGKPSRALYDEFVNRFKSINKELNKKQFLVPYFISSHPGSTLKEAIELALYFKKEKIKPEQVQDFYPTPATASTCMYYTGRDPFTKQEVYIAKNPHEKAMQRALLQYYLPQNQRLVIEALNKAGRYDLIGYGPQHLVAPLKKD